MYLFKIIFITLILLIIFRLFNLSVYRIIDKIFKIENPKPFFDLPLSFTFLILFLGIFCIVITMNSATADISLLEYYLMYCVIGIASILWCYLEWELDIKSLPKISSDDKTISKKKIIIFSFVMLFSFGYGYAAFNKEFSGQNLDPSLIIANITIVPGIIALDRVLNQIKQLYIEHKKN